MGIGETEKQKPALVRWWERRWRRFNRWMETDYVRVGVAIRVVLGAILVCMLIALALPGCSTVGYYCGSLGKGDCTEKEINIESGQDKKQADDAVVKKK